jgi:putative pyruvate formate lyase activating enzyme
MSKQQSDITIGPNGSIHISFLWNDLCDLAGMSSAECFSSRTWIAPSSELTLESGEYSSCNLCPKQCGFDRNAAAHPRCGDSLLRISNAGLTMGDEPSIRGTRGSGAIMLAGCPLKCPSCHNPEKVAQGEPSSAVDFFRICESLNKEGAHNIQILSPTGHFPALRTLLRALKEESFPLPIVLKSSGYESVDELRKLEGLVDIYLPDLKFGTCSTWAVRAGARSYFTIAQEAIEEMIRQVGNLSLEADGTARKGVLVRHVAAPLPTTEQAELKSYLMSLSGRAGVSILDTFVDLER